MPNSKNIIHQLSAAVPGFVRSMSFVILKDFSILVMLNGFGRAARSEDLLCERIWRHRPSAGNDSRIKGIQVSHRRRAGDQSQSGQLFLGNRKTAVCPQR